MLHRTRLRDGKQQDGRNRIVMRNLHDFDGALVPVGRHGDAAHVLHLGGVGEHDGGLSRAGEAVDLGATDAVVGGGCSRGDKQEDGCRQKGGGGMLVHTSPVMYALAAA